MSFMGSTDETRHLWMANEQAVISPRGQFMPDRELQIILWGMAGENLDYGDMDGCSIPNLR